MKCLYDQWCDETAVNLSTFYVLLFKAIQAADGTNRAKLIAAFPDLFKDSENL